MRSVVTAALIFAFAAALRFVYLSEITGTPLTEVLLIDSETYDRFARRILDGTFHGEDVYSMNPLYPYFLAGLYRAFSPSMSVALVVQALLSALTAVMVYRIGERVFGRAVGILSGVVAAAYGPSIFYGGALLTPTLIDFLCTGMLLLLLRFERTRHLRDSLAAGLLLGLAGLARGNSFLFVPLSLPFFRIASGTWRSALKGWSAFAAGAIALLGAVTARNYVVEGEIVPISANYAAFYIGHNPDANGLYTMPSFVESASFEGEVVGTREAISEILGRPLTLAETSRYLLVQGLRHIREHPWAELKLLARKFYFFWNRTESPTNLSYYFARDHSALLRGLPIHFGIIAPLGLLGVVLARRGWRRQLLFYLYGAVYLATALVFFVSAEYRMPILPVLIIYASFATVQLGLGLGEFFSRGPRESPTPGRPPGDRSILGHAALLAVLVAFSNVRTPLLASQTMKRVDYLNFGTLYLQRGDLDHAKEMLERSLRIDPAFGPAHAALAEVHHRAGDELAAVRHQELAARHRLGGQYQSLERESGAGDELLFRAAGDYEAGRFRDALSAFERLRKRHADRGARAEEVRMMNNIGLCLYKLGDLDRAEEILREIIERDSAYVYAHTNLARVYRAARRPEEAERHLAIAERLAREDPRVRRAREEFRSLTERPPESSID
jgi:tetratricopeptide (TPR) repeat protein